MGYSMEELADRMEIIDVITRYVHALDDLDIDALDSVFTADCMFDLTSAGAMRGQWASIVKPFFASMHKSFKHDFHYFTNSRITFVDQARTQARVRHKVVNPCVVVRDGKEFHHQIHGTYDDLFVRKPEGWRVQERTWNMGWISGDNPYVGTTIGEARIAAAN